MSIQTVRHSNTGIRYWQKYVSLSLGTKMILIPSRMPQIYLLLTSILKLVRYTSCYLMKDTHISSAETTFYSTCIHDFAKKMQQSTTTELLSTVSGGSEKRRLPLNIPTDTRHFISTYSGLAQKISQLFSPVFKRSRN